MHLRTHNTHQEIHTPAHSRVHGKCIFFYVCIVCAVNKKCTCAHTIHTKKYIRPRTLGYTVRVSKCIFYLLHTQYTHRKIYTYTYRVS